MKRPLTIAATAFLAILILYACASTIRTASTSFVTITIGDTPNTALLKAEAATPWARFKYFLVDVKLVAAAYAYIPSIVQAIVVTVTAPDITTPIVGISNLSSNQTTATIKIEVPNGLARKFTVEGIHGVTSQATYRASTEADLDGTDITLPISMQFNFFGSAIFVDAALGNDTLYSGLTYTRPFKTISRALSLQSSSTPYSAIPVIWVEFGDYLPVGAGGSETFPLQLNPGTALICGGKGFSTVIGAPGGTKILGNTGASIDNCKITVPFGGNGINDQATRIKINGVYIEITGSGTSPNTIGAILSNDSTILESTITGSGSVSGPVFGVQVNGGKPDIIGNTITRLPTGINLTSTAGNAVITSNTITGNTTGVNVLTSGNPAIGLNSISNNSSFGIYVAAGSPEIMSNTINGNSIGLEVQASAGVPIVSSNGFYCNTNTDFFSNKSPGIDIRDNAWDHDLTTSPSGTLGPTDKVSINGNGDCGGGVDICWQFSQPDYTRNSAAVPVPPACR